MGSKVFKVLSIDGGGIKGLYSSTILEHLEKRYGGRCSDFFDLICGTSTGGLIALALSLRIPATDISRIYSEHGKEIFPVQNGFLGILRQTFWKGKYKEDSLKRVLVELFGDRVLGESNNLLCIPTYSITDARPWIFKFDHKEGGLSRDNTSKYVDVALATSAAPTYFPLSEIADYDYKQFIDGGVWANNPALVGFIEAFTYFVGNNKDFDSVQILSVSSLNNTAGKPTGLKRRRSFLHWRDDLFETSMIGQNSFTHYFLTQMHKLTGVPIEYVRIPSETISAEQQQLVQLDMATTESLRFIRGKGNDRGTLASKDTEIAEFFKSKKTYKTN
jgi:predicted acylesterase/phospholipase RssA